MWIHDMFGADKPIVALLHPDALPGDPGFCGDIDAVLNHAAHDLTALRDGSVGGILTADKFSLSYQLVADIAATPAMACIIGRLKDRVRVPFGISVVKDPITTINLATTTGAHFGRSCFSGTYMGKYGVYVSSSGGAVRYRKALGMEHLKLLFKVNPEADAYLVQWDIQMVARSIMFGDFADGLCMSGAAAGAEPDGVALSRVYEAAGQKSVPMFCNIGYSHQNVRGKLKHCDAVCVGSAFRKDGIFNQRVDERRVRDFMEIVKEIRGES